MPRAGVSIMVLRQGAEGAEVLLVRRAGQPWPDVWSLPGGKVEPGEPVRAAALRELKEETGVSAEILRLLDVVDVIERDSAGQVRSHYILSVFAGRWLGGEARAASDAAEARWVPLGELDALRMTPGTADLIRRVAEDIGDDPPVGSG